MCIYILESSKHLKKISNVWFGLFYLYWKTYHFLTDFARIAMFIEKLPKEKSKQNCKFFNTVYKTIHIHLSETKILLDWCITLSLSMRLRKYFYSEFWDFKICEHLVIMGAYFWFLIIINLCDFYISKYNKQQ